MALFRNVKGGTRTNDSAATGQVGEFQTAALASGSATSLTTATEKTIISVSLTAGDWDVWGGVVFLFAATTVPTRIRAGISTTNNTLVAAPDGGDVFMDATFTTASTQALQTGCARISIAATTTVYLVAYAVFTTSTTTAYGSIYARRAR